MKEENRFIKRALISVTDKSHLASLVDTLHKNNVEIISTGGTKKFIEDLGIPVTCISKVTGNPEAFGGRMKSISFPVTSALLYRRHNSTDLEEARELKIEAIDLVVCNLYPFDQYAGKNSEEDILIENIDIGGPLMLRASAKNYESVTVLSDISDYEKFISLFNENNGAISFKMRRDLAIKTFTRVAQYDCLIAEELSSRFLDDYKTGDLPWLSITPKETLRYGENPHQWAKIFKLKNTKSKNNLVDAEVLQGKELSYNNWGDADAAWRVMSDVTNVSPGKNIVAIIKHANPCGLAVASSMIDALEEAWQGDSISSFGGVLAFSHAVDLECAKFLSERFIEVVIASDYSAEALKVFQKKKNVRLLKVPVREKMESEFIVKSISGGLLMQNEDESNGESEPLTLVTKMDMSAEAKELVDFGILACKHLKSNGIALVYKTDKGRLTLAGTGMGQPNRLDSLKLLAKIRAEQKGLALDKMVLISDAFFPFADSVEVCNEVGIRNIVQPGGSIRDDEVIEACNRFGIAMMTTGKRHFRH
ncbi:MAG: bifunctional phosphoribosylaminoimidazolecarboxamide formyltransferase/IMP cyclohydrolase [Bacteriovorax sp.]|nr:bifunctional phosphoribosylaminoimidazolecarboxamide formyltransferase/IMP cyclohydrolase [Bacteriovorax sp.]